MVMMLSPTGFLITLLTDFGDRDGYDAVMKGVIAGLCPQARVVDLTHRVPPQDVRSGAFILAQALPYFPLGTVHLAVVDPGVGGDRPAIAFRWALGYGVGPDNGLFSRLWETYPPEEVVVLDRPAFWRSPHLSQTFHGRDLFAPVAAHLVSGKPLTAVGTRCDRESLVQLAPAVHEQEGDRVQGYFQYFDHFGNGVTTIPGQVVAGRPWIAQIRGLTIPGGKTYGDRPWESYVALVGSHGWVEIARNGGSAKAGLGLDYFTPLHVDFPQGDRTTMG